MKLSDEARALMMEMREAAVLRVEYAAVEREYHRVLEALEEGSEAVDFGLLSFLDRERRAYRKALAMRRARNWAILTQPSRAKREEDVPEDDDILGAQVLRLRYAQGYPWSRIVAITGQGRRAVRKAHNEALEVLAKGGWI